MTTDHQVPAGWYPDPLGLPQLRWWDGQGWAEHVSEARRPLFARPTATVFADPDDELLEPDEVVPEPATAETGDPVLPPTPQPTAFASEPPALPAGSDGPAQGWGGAALTLHSMRAAGVPMILEIEVAGHPPLVIDTRHDAFAWELGLDRFPAEPSSVAVSVRIAEATTPPAFELPGGSLDGLLWNIGLAAFPDEAAPWLQPGQSYRLRRWPDLSGFEPDTDKVRQAAMLSNGAFTVEQLANFTGRSVEPTRSLLNALSLIGVLEVVAR